MEIPHSPGGCSLYIRKGVHIVKREGQHDFECGALGGVGGVYDATLFRLSDVNVMDGSFKSTWFIVYDVWDMQVNQVTTDPSGFKLVI